MKKVHVTPLAMRIFVLLSWLRIERFTGTDITDNLWEYCHNWPRRDHVQNAVAILEDAGLVENVAGDLWRLT